MLKERLKKIGLLGGTFDPIHMGHLNLAFELMEKGQLEEVWFIPAQVNPHKIQTPPTPMEHRIQMVQLAIQQVPQFILKDLELKRPPPSYTIDTLRAFISEEAIKPSPNQFYLLMGEDAIPGFFKWHLPEEIVQLVPLLIGSRSGRWPYEQVDEYNLAIREAILRGLTQTRLMDISSTEVRQRLSRNLYCGHLIPLPVLQYIHHHGLYRSSFQRVNS